MPAKKVKIPILPENGHNSDSSADSEDEELALRVGKIPMKWYDEFRHLGYNIEAKKIEKQRQSSFPISNFRLSNRRVDKERRRSKMVGQDKGHFEQSRDISNRRTIGANLKNPKWKIR